MLSKEDSTAKETWRDGPNARKPSSASMNALAEEKHEDQQRSDEPMQAHGNSVISGSSGNRHDSNPFQRAQQWMDGRSRNFR